MPPTEKKRCKQCRTDKQKCVLQDAADRCDRCISRNCPCEDRRWPSPNRRLRTDAQIAEASQRESRTSQPNVDAANIQRMQPSNPSSGTLNNDYRGSSYTGGNSNSAYSSYQSYNGYGYGSLDMSPSFSNSMQPQVPTYFGVNNQQVWASPTYTNGAGVDVDTSFYQQPGYYTIPSRYNQQGGAYRGGRR